MVTIPAYYFFNVLSSCYGVSPGKWLYMKTYFDIVFRCFVHNDRNIFCANITLIPPRDCKNADTGVGYHFQVLLDDFRIAIAIQSQKREEITCDIIIFPSN